MPLTDAPLGHSVAYPSKYDASLLFPIPRAENRAALGLNSLPALPGTALPFHGTDIWNAYELSWLDPKGKPRIAMASFRVPADSPNIIESKSFKLYLNSFNQTRLANAQALRERLETDLSAAAGAAIEMDFILPQRFDTLRIVELDGITLDKLDVDIDRYDPAPELLRCAAGEIVEETLVSRLLKSNCPVTGQPDWGSVQIAYRGRPIDRAALLKYIISFRQHAEFHEHCVERIFCDLMRACQPEQLAVYARYTRRGGLDINPWRSNGAGPAPADVRTARQ
ncbi:NADPH-dependent 7-cyano-7-deazaguanine reductase QueF [Bordetella genomosp. 12]|uniref:NADPH-dependent 7-cyano-7-deazaguanine reductase n=1 Tax=Bordetella genomosp. 12 TaxID=463035 RepID=A0A261VDR8_9BORD|nr:NADPH-dependent 7-cyano-7-deazaguanine reductase QueF [Bordetella genomosp. 12]OZI72288.1 NADPH-dependent 7-cyano-7-deazaguanine reductase QueF [Bordetella genomosp. 12]